MLGHTKEKRREKRKRSQRDLDKNMARWKAAGNELEQEKGSKSSKKPRAASYGIEQHRQHHIRESSVQEAYSSLKATAPTASSSSAVLEQRGEWHEGTIPRGGRDAFLEKLDSYLNQYEGASTFDDIHAALTDLGDMVRWLKTAQLPRGNINEYAKSTMSGLGERERGELTNFARRLKNQPNIWAMVDNISHARNIAAHFYDSKQRAYIASLERELSTPDAQRRVIRELAPPSMQDHQGLLDAANARIKRQEGDKVSALVLLDRLRFILSEAKRLRAALGGGSRPQPTQAQHLTSATQTTQRSPGMMPQYPPPAPFLQPPPGPPQHIPLQYVGPQNAPPGVGGPVPGGPAQSSIPYGYPQYAYNVYPWYMYPPYGQSGPG